MAVRPHAPVDGAARGGARVLPRLTRRVFTDLAVWMAGLGVLIGVVFPFVVIPLGVPGAVSLRPGFFAATLSAGLLVGTVNFLLARAVVGGRLRALSGRMRFVSEAIEVATYTGDWSGCDPDDCSLAIDSADEIGEAAASFNQLLGALAESRSVEVALSGYVHTLTTHLALDTLADAALDGLIRHAGAAAGALCVVQDEGAVVAASRRLEADRLLDSSVVVHAFDADGVVLIDVPPALRVDAAVVDFRPAAVALAPVRFKDATVGLAVLAFERQPAPERIQLVDGLRGPTGVALHNALTHDRFQRLAAVDPLTGVYNRRFGLGRLREEFARALRTGAPLALLAIDVDHFKTVNDTYGHLTGDRVLREIAHATRHVLREGDVLVRTGGEEFVALLPGAGVDDLRAVGERIRRTVAAVSAPAGDVAVRVTVSLGGVSFPSVDVASPEELLEHADQALYRAKNSGRDRLRLAPAPPGRARSA